MIDISQETRVTETKTTKKKKKLYPNTANAYLFMENYLAHFTISTSTFCCFHLQFGVLSHTRISISQSEYSLHSRLFSVCHAVFWRFNVRAMRMIIDY